MAASQRTSQDEMRADILTALEKVMLRKTYTEIGIGDICAEAYISKPTFYRYFQNKDDVFRWISRYALRTGVAEVGRKYGWYEGNYRTACIHYRHKALFSDTQSPSLIAYLIECGSQYLRDELIETIVERRGGELTDKLAFQIDCFVTASGLMSRKWAQDDMALPPDVIADYLSSVVPHDLFELLNEPQEAPQP